MIMVLLDKAVSRKGYRMYVSSTTTNKLRAGLNFDFKSKRDPRPQAFVSIWLCLFCLVSVASGSSAQREE